MNFVQVQLLNEQKFEMHMELVDFDQTFGAFIDRELNRDKQVFPIQNNIFYRKKHENYTAYMPGIRNYGDKLTVNMELLLKITTNLKLDLVDKEQKRLVPEN